MEKKYKTNFIQNGIESGKSLSSYLESKMLHVEHEYEIEGSDNCIFIFDNNSFNWKTRNQIVRFNCKEDIYNLVKLKTEWDHLDNSKSDKERHYSFILNDISQLDTLIEILLKSGLVF